ncbi:MAG: radical SAM protein [Myxococcales bacterium]|nr:radical SAM protein [Myxococcales bacterium]
MRIAVLTRPDLFPAWHGAAVKIVRTVEALAARGDTVSVVTEDRDRYWRVTNDGWSEVPFGGRFRAVQEWPVLRNQARAARWVARAGYPAEETLLYRPMFDPAWWARVLYVGQAEGIEVWQPEFPGFVVPAWIARSLLGGRITLGTHNAEFHRLAQTNAFTPARVNRLRRLEALLLNRADDVVACSVEDVGRLREAGVTRPVWHIPHGVQVGAYRAPASIDLRVRYGLAGGPVLFFHGTLHYGPNRDAVEYLATKLAPRLPSSTTLLITGLSPPRELERPRALEGEADGAAVHFTGPVDDLAGHIRAADLCLCPVFAGGGTRMKLLEYFAAGKPVVSTALGAEGLRVTHDSELIIADRDGFAGAVNDLLWDAPARRRLGQAARRWVAAYDWNAVGEAWQAVHRGQGRDFVPQVPVDAHLPVREVSKPRTLLFLINRGCNLRCSFCDLWEGNENVPLDEAARLFDEAVAIETKTVVLTGGEPLLHPRFFEIVAEVRKRGLSVNVTTNGTLVDRHWERIVSGGIDSISVSLDGLADTHDRLRGRPGSFNRTWTALERIVAHHRTVVAARKAGDPSAASLLDPCVYFTVTRENVGELLAVWRKVRELGARFDFWPVNDAPELYLRPEDAPVWQHAVATIAAEDSGVAGRSHYYAQALGYHRGETSPMRCLGFIDQYGVRYDGAFLPCCVWGGDGLVAGNVFETPLSTLWRSPDVQARREQMFNTGCTVGCYNHSLYEFGVSTGLSHRVTPAGAIRK